MLEFLSGLIISGITLTVIYIRRGKDTQELREDKIYKKVLKERNKVNSKNFKTNRSEVPTDWYK